MGTQIVNELNKFKQIDQAYKNIRIIDLITLI